MSKSRIEANKPQLTIELDASFFSDAPLEKLSEDQSRYASKFNKFRHNFHKMSSRINGILTRADDVTFEQIQAVHGDELNRGIYCLHPSLPDPGVTKVLTFQVEDANTNELTKPLLTNDEIAIFYEHVIRTSDLLKHAKLETNDNGFQQIVLTSKTTWKEDNDEEFWSSLAEQQCSSKEVSRILTKVIDNRQRLNLQERRLVCNDFAVMFDNDVKVERQKYRNFVLLTCLQRPSNNPLGVGGFYHDCNTELGGLLTTLNNIGYKKLFPKIFGENDGHRRLSNKEKVARSQVRSLLLSNQDASSQSIQIDESKIITISSNIVFDARREHDLDVEEAAVTAQVKFQLDMNKDEITFFPAKITIDPQCSVGPSLSAAIEHLANEEFIQNNTRIYMAQEEDSDESLSESDEELQARQQLHQTATHKVYRDGQPDLDAHRPSKRVLKGDSLGRKFLNSCRNGFSWMRRNPWKTAGIAVGVGLFLVSASISAALLATGIGTPLGLALSALSIDVSLTLAAEMAITSATLAVISGVLGGATAAIGYLATKGKKQVQNVDIEKAPRNNNRVLYESDDPTNIVVSTVPVKKPGLKSKPIVRIGSCHISPPQNGVKQSIQNKSAVGF